jgi:hypothetical protein
MNTRICTQYTVQYWKGEASETIIFTKMSREYAD